MRCKMAFRRMASLITARSQSTSDTSAPVKSAWYVTALMKYAPFNLLLLNLQRLKLRPAQSSRAPQQFARQRCKTVASAPSKRLQLKATAAKRTGHQHS